MHLRATRNVWFYFCSNNRSEFGDLNVTGSSTLTQGENEACYLLGLAEVLTELK